MIILGTISMWNLIILASKHIDFRDLLVREVRGVLDPFVLALQDDHL